MRRATLCVSHHSGVLHAPPPPMIACDDARRRGAGGLARDPLGPRASAPSIGLACPRRSTRPHTRFLDALALRFPLDTTDDMDAPSSQVLAGQEPSRRIKSPLLCRLSYAPVVRQVDRGRGVTATAPRAAAACKCCEGRAPCAAPTTSTGTSLLVPLQRPASAPAPRPGTRERSRVPHVRAVLQPEAFRPAPRMCRHLGPARQERARALALAQEQG